MTRPSSFGVCAGLPEFSASETYLDAMQKPSALAGVVSALLFKVGVFAGFMARVVGIRLVRRIHSSEVWC